MSVIKNIQPVNLSTQVEDDRLHESGLGKKEERYTTRCSSNELDESQKKEKKMEIPAEED